MLIDLFSQSNITCREQDLDIRRSYIQDCGTIIPNGVSHGEIKGYSEESVSSFYIVIMPNRLSNLDDYIEETFLNLTSFGENSNEMQSWVNTHLNTILNAQRETTIDTVIGEIYMGLVGEPGRYVIALYTTN